MNFHWKNFGGYITISGLRARVLNYEVIRGFAPIFLLASISNSEKYQRDIKEDHAEEIKRYLEEDYGRFFPEIILGYNESYLDPKFRDSIKITNLKRHFSPWGPYHYDFMTKFARIQIKNVNEVKKAITRVDGNHRLAKAEVFEHKVIEDFIVSFCLIIFKEDQKRGNEELIFHTINHTAIPLVDEENFKVIVENEETFSNSQLKQKDPALFLTRLIGREEHPALKSIFDNFGSSKKLTKIYEISEILLKSYPSFLIEYTIDSEIKTYFLELLGKVNVIYGSLTHKMDVEKLNYIVPLIVYIFLNKENKNESKTKWWLERFIEWLYINNLFSLREVEYQKIWNIFYKIFESKSNRIFISMQFDENEKDLYPTIMRAIDQTGNEQGRSLEAVKIDDYRKGVTYGIDEEILKKIREGGLLIGDISTNNANVFHEIGYMMGLCHQKGIEGQVILLCNEEKIKQAGGTVKFNLEHQKQVRYSSYSQLEKELKAELKMYYERYKIDSIPL